MRRQWHSKQMNVSLTAKKGIGNQQETYYIYLKHTTKNKCIFFSIVNDG